MTSTTSEHRIRPTELSGSERLSFSQPMAERTGLAA